MKLVYMLCNVPFLFPNKKGTKEIGIGVALIASQNVPSPKNLSRSLKTNT